MNSALLFLALAIAWPVTITSLAGTWQDHFNRTSLSAEWLGDRSAFEVSNGVLTGVSARPVAPSPLNVITVAVDCTNGVVGAWVNVISPNTHVCTKGALVLRQSGTNGYVFALHEATQTIEVFRLEDKQILLSQSAKIELQHWYYLRAELSGETMRFLVDGKLVGTVVDSGSGHGGAGVAVQDANAVSFDDFSVSGTAIVGNVDSISAPVLLVAQGSAGEIAFKFNGEPGFVYAVQAASVPFTHDWQTVTNFLVKLVPTEGAYSEGATGRMRFYRVEKTDCNCD